MAAQEEDRPGDVLGGGDAAERDGCLRCASPALAGVKAGAHISVSTQPGATQLTSDVGRILDGERLGERDEGALGGGVVARGMPRRAGPAVLDTITTRPPAPSARSAARVAENTASRLAAMVARQRSTGSVPERHFLRRARCRRWPRSSRARRTRARTARRQPVGHGRIGQIAADHERPPAQRADLAPPPPPLRAPGCDR